MTRPPATRKDHERFCITEGWTRRRSTRGRKGTDHVRFEFALPNGELLYTRISHPVDRSDYGPHLWAHILRDQLMVTEEAFWKCVNDSVHPDRGGVPGPTGESIPLGVVITLIEEFHLPEAEVMHMSKAEAIARLTELYSIDRQPGTIE